MQMLGNTHTSCACAGRTGQGALQVQPAAIVGRRPAAAAVGAAIGATVAIGAAIGAAVRAAPAGRAGARPAARPTSNASSVGASSACLNSEATILRARSEPPALFQTCACVCRRRACSPSAGPALLNTGARAAAADHRYTTTPGQTVSTCVWRQTMHIRL